MENEHTSRVPYYYISNIYHKQNASYALADSLHFTENMLEHVCPQGLTQ